MIWKALSDPTRRSILDLLKNAPQTTGDISSHFSGNLSRFAIMKHLNVLQEANLITYKREGKFRWNYLNTAPFQETYQKWVSNLVQLRQYVGNTSDTMGIMEKKIQTTTIRSECFIKASPTQVWKVLTEGVGDWWIRDYFTHPKTKEMVLEVKLGGLLYESTTDQQGIVWANIIGLNAPHTIQLKGLLTPAFGGPAISFLSFTLKKENSQTRLIFEDQILGNLSDQIILDLENRWNRLLENGLKKYIETN